jgi:hypothetical protein
LEVGIAFGLVLNQTKPNPTNLVRIWMPKYLTGSGLVLVIQNRTKLVKPKPHQSPYKSVIIFDKARYVPLQVLPYSHSSLMSAASHWLLTDKGYVPSQIGLKPKPAGLGLGLDEVLVSSNQTRLDWL